VEHLVDGGFERTALTNIGQVEAEAVTEGVDNGGGIRRRNFSLPSAPCVAGLRPASFTGAWSVTKACTSRFGNARRQIAAS
jgi:hypothetical protein